MMDVGGASVAKGNTPEPKCDQCEEFDDLELGDLEEVYFSPGVKDITHVLQLRVSKWSMHALQTLAEENRCNTIQMAQRLLSKGILEEYGTGLVPCGPWLGFPLWKKLWLTGVYWVPMFASANWQTIKGGVDREFDNSYWGTVQVNATCNQASKHHWLWYEGDDQLEKNAPQTYPVGWQYKRRGKSRGFWYPFW